jgi:hypothetical protein
MAHEWIIEVLADLRDFARANGLREVAAKTEEALDTARRELAEGKRTAEVFALFQPPADPH